MGVFGVIGLLGFGIGLLAMLGVILSRSDPHGGLARAGLASMLVGFVGLAGLVVTKLIG